MKKKFFTGLVVAIFGSLMLSFSAFADGTDLDNIGTALPSTTASQQVETPAASNPQSGSSSKGNGIDYSQLGPDAEDMAAATELVAPVVKWVNIGIGVLTALLGTILIASTVIDLVYIISPSFIRNIGSQSAAAATQGGMMGGMPGQAPVATGFASLISDDCRSALDECGAPGGVSPAPAGGMGGMGMGGMGMGGMPPMGMGMGAPAAAPISKKAVVLTYMKKRVFTFVLIGICAVLLTCTCFLDVGTKIGMWILEIVSGI